MMVLVRTGPRRCKEEKRGRTRKKEGGRDVTCVECMYAVSALAATDCA